MDTSENLKDSEIYLFFIFFRYAQGSSSALRSYTGCNPLFISTSHASCSAWCKRRMTLRPIEDFHRGTSRVGPRGLVQGLDSPQKHFFKEKYPELRAWRNARHLADLCQLADLEKRLPADFQTQ